MRPFVSSVTGGIIRICRAEVCVGNRMAGKNTSKVNWEMVKNCIEMLKPLLIYIYHFHSHSNLENVLSSEPITD